MLLNRISIAKFDSISSVRSFSPTKRIAFKGKNDSFESMPEVIFGNINPNKANEIINTVNSENKLSSGWTSDVYKYDDMIIKVPSRKTFQTPLEEQQFNGQNLREYFVLDEINKIDPTIATKPMGIIRNKDSYYLAEELINGKHPKGNHLSKGHLEDLLSKFIKLDTNGIVNCDLQSGNIFLTSENKTKLIDFGSYNYILNNGQIVSSDYMPSEIFKPNGQIYAQTSLNSKFRFIKTFLQDNFIDIKSQADNPYLKVQSNATNFEYRTLYAHLLDNSEENPLEFFKTYLKTKAQTYHAQMKSFLESLDFNEITSGEFSQECISTGKEKLKQAINYETLLKEILTNPDDDVVKTELAKLQLRTFLNLGDSLKSPIENSKKLQSAYNQLIETINSAIQNSTGDKQNYFIQMLTDFENKFKDYNFADGQVEIPDNENLIKVLFKKQVQKIKESTPETIKENIGNIQNSAKNSDEKLGVAISALLVTILTAITALIIKKRKNKVKNMPIQQSNIEFNNNKETIIQNHNTASLKNLPNAFKQFQ